MSAITSADNYAACLVANSEHFVQSRTQSFTTIAGSYVSLWLGTGSPGGGSAPGAAAVSTKSTTGSMANFTNPGSGEFAHLQDINFLFNGGASASIHIYDRLVHMGGLSGTVVTPTVQNVNTVAITRGDTTGFGVQAWLECYTDLGATPATATVSYTNSAGTAGRTATVSIPANYRQGRLLPILPLQGDDLGVRSVETVTLSVSTGTAGNFGVTLGREICVAAMGDVSLTPTVRRGLNLGLPLVASDACIWWVAQTETTTLSPLNGGMTIFTTDTPGAITSVADVETAVSTRGQTFPILREFSFTTLAGRQLSSWASVGIPAAGATPGLTSAVPTNATVGALAPFVDPSGGQQAFLYRVDMVIRSTACPFDFYDRLVHMGGLSGTDTALKTINTTAITRGDTNGVEVVGFVECYTQLGSTPQTLTVSYTNTAGTAGRSTTVSIPATMRAGQVIPIPLVAGDFGIKSIETVQLGGSTGTAGNYGITLGRRVAVLEFELEDVPCTLAGMDLGLPKLEPGACLWLVGTASSNSSPAFMVGNIIVATTG